MHFLAFLAETDPSIWERLLEKWGFPTVALALVAWWAKPQIERLISSHVALIDLLGKHVVGTSNDVSEMRPDVVETKSLVRKVLKHVRPKGAIDEEDEA